jgi:Nickel-dependent hydrogenase/NADH ubiquinone oxidoreductase, 20 Kd subunit
LIWRQFQDCAGNSESILRSPHPDVAEIVLETLAWNYHELIMAGSGDQAEAMSTQAVRDLKGKYIAVVEGAIPTVVKQAVDATVKKLGVGPAALYSTLGRVAARALESVIVMSRLEGWLNQLERNAQSGDLRIADTAKWSPSSWPSSARGFGPHEVPRGSLGHLRCPSSPHASTNNPAS